MIHRAVWLAHGGEQYRDELSHHVDMCAQQFSLVNEHEQAMAAVKESDREGDKAGRDTPGSNLHALLAQVVRQLIPEDSDMAGG